MFKRIEYNDSIDFFNRLIYSENGLCKPTIRTYIAQLIRVKVAGDYLYSRSENFKHATHTNALLHFIEQKLVYFCKDITDMQNMRDRVKEVINDLASVGDIYHLGKGQYLPTPFRLVSIDSKNHMLCVGSFTVPKALNDKINQKISYYDHLRFAQCNLETDQYEKEMNFIDYSDFFMTKYFDISEWFSYFLHDFNSQRTDSIDIELGNYEFYIPEKNKRWINHNEFITDVKNKDNIVVLARKKSESKYLNKYERILLKIQVMNKDNIKPIKIKRLKDNDYKRLIYGFDIHYKKPMHAELASYDNSTTLELHRFLPCPHDKLLSFGTKNTKEKSTKYRFPLLLHPVIISVLDFYKIKLITP